MLQHFNFQINFIIKNTWNLFLLKINLTSSKHHLDASWVSIISIFKNCEQKREQKNYIGFTFLPINESSIKTRTLQALVNRI